MKIMLMICAIAAVVALTGCDTIGAGLTIQTDVVAKPSHHHGFFHKHHSEKPQVNIINIDPPDDHSRRVGPPADRPRGQGNMTPRREGSPRHMGPPPNTGPKGARQKKI